MKDSRKVKSIHCMSIITFDSPSIRNNIKALDIAQLLAVVTFRNCIVRLLFIERFLVNEKKNNELLWNTTSSFGKLSIRDSYCSEATVTMKKLRCLCSLLYGALCSVQVHLAYKRVFVCFHLHYHQNKRKTNGSNAECVFLLSKCRLCRRLVLSTNLVSSNQIIDCKLIPYKDFCLNLLHHEFLRFRCQCILQK